ncbi:NUDIX domain-containing protein [Halococcus sp. AFM35]|uniref:NUDIX domain-containing protein n=1 Tax=Halococcus sp. AFM35 TaxID=3421653 RepID=UPI003EBAF8B8
MSWREIRPVALAAVRRENGEILVAEHEDPDENDPFYRLIGGGVEFGEHSRDAVVREFREELDVTLTNVAHIGTYERTFTFDGERSHEIWRVFAGDIAEGWPYKHERFEGHEPELGETFAVTWLAPNRLRNDVTFYDPIVLDDLD